MVEIGLGDLILLFARFLFRHGAQVPRLALTPWVREIYCCNGELVLNEAPPPPPNTTLYI